MDSSDEYTVVQMKNGSLYTWGKNDRGQMGTGSGIGMDMVESENVPTRVLLRNEAGELVAAQDFTMGQNTMMIRDTDGNVYITGLKLNYEPKRLNFSADLLQTTDIDQMGCGAKHYIILTKDNNYFCWGNVFKT